VRPPAGDPQEIDYPTLDGELTVRETRRLTFDRLQQRPASR
jgi:hypothetical protein